MNFRDAYTVLEAHKFFIFSFEDLLSFYPDEDTANLKQSVFRWKEKGWIYALKRGLYELTYPRDHIVPDMYVANKLYGPSYVSLETALSYFSVIPEVAMAVTSVTTKPTRTFRNKHGLFMYRTIRREAFTGYYVERQGDFEMLIAEPEKAFVDYLYFKTYRGTRIELRDERIDKTAVSRLDHKKVKKYAGLYNIRGKGLYAYL